MPLFSPKRKISDTENKLRVLYCLDALGMATLDQLWPFVAQLELMEYIPLCLFVDELRADGAVAAASHALEGALYLTAQGHKQLDLFLGKLVHADKERIRKAAPEYVSRMSARRQAQAVYEGEADGMFRAACTLREDDVPALMLRITSPDSTLVDRAVKGFRSCVPHLMSLLYTLPFEPQAEDLPAALPMEEALSAAQPNQPALCDFGGRACAAVVRAAHETTQYTLLLLLPDERLAWGWALAAQQSGLGERLTRLIETRAEDA